MKTLSPLKGMEQVTTDATQETPKSFLRLSLYKRCMLRGGALIIVLFIISCHQAGKNQFLRIPLSPAESALLGLDPSESNSYLLVTKSSDQMESNIPPTLDEGFYSSEEPAERRQTRAKYEKLNESKKKLLARSIVMAADWDKLYRKFNTIMSNYYEYAVKQGNREELDYYGKKSDQASCWIIVQECPYIRSALRNLRKDKELAPLIGDATLNNCPILDNYSLGIFEIVIDHYIVHYPTDKRGWDFLWFMMIMQEVEYPQFRTIKELIHQKGLIRFPYGKKIFEMVKDYGYVEACPTGRKPLDYISESNDAPT